MTSARFPSLSASIAALAVAVVTLGLPIAGAAADTVTLASHRAVYDLKLGKSRGKRTVESVRGRLLYDFSGSTCEGYSLQFRQVSELDTGEGKVAVSDLRATTWEEGTSKALRFSSQNRLNEQLNDDVDGRAERESDGIGVTLKKPSEKSFRIDAGAVFPTEHVRRAIEAARAGKTILEFPVFDGSETGEKVYNSLTVIGQPIHADKAATDAGQNQVALKGLMRWPMTISYFDRASTTGEQTPVYAISFELYENGVSRNLLLDYGDFTVTGELSQIEFRDVKPCQ